MQSEPLARRVRRRAPLPAAVRLRRELLLSDQSRVEQELLLPRRKMPAARVRRVAGLIVALTACHGEPPASSANVEANACAGLATDARDANALDDLTVDGVSDLYEHDRRGQTLRGAELEVRAERGVT